MKIYFYTLILFVNLSTVFSQKTPTDEMEKKYRENQIELDKNHSGIGIMLYKPSFGDLSTIESNWIGINVLSDILEFKLGFGRTFVNGEIPFGFTGTQQVNTREYGAQLSVGANVPIPFLALGAQRSPRSVFRGHPVFGVEFGTFRFHNFNSYMGDAQTSILYMGFNPGYRIRIPFGSVEFNLNTRLGMSTGDNPDFYKGAGFYPSITVRVDAMKWFYSPEMVSVKGSQTTVSNVETTTRRVGTRYRSDGSGVAYYRSYTTADVSVQSMNIGVQDIGPHFGVGPKVSWMNPRRSAYVPNSLLVGAVAEGRSGFLDYGFTVEGGVVGHGSELEAKGEEVDDFRRKLDKSETYGQGKVNTVNLFANAGIDISPLFLMPLGITIDKGDATSFLSSSVGFIVGTHVTWGQRFEDSESGLLYDVDVLNDQGVTSQKFIDPREIGPGFLGGFYFSVQVGAMAFKLTNYRYYGAPFASNTMLSIAYRIPVGRR